MMTVHVAKGDGHVPLWAAVTLIVTILLGSVGYILYAVQRGADVEHRMLHQEYQQLSNEASTRDDIVKSNTFNISEMKSDIAAIKQMLIDIDRRMK